MTRADGVFATARVIYSPLAKAARFALKPLPRPRAVSVYVNQRAAACNLSVPAGTTVGSKTCCDFWRNFSKALLQP